jgi:hypothetical protein
MRITVSLAPEAARLLNGLVQDVQRAQREASLVTSALVAQGGVTQPAVLAEVGPDFCVVEVPDDGQ